MNWFRILGVIVLVVLAAVCVEIGVGFMTDQSMKYRSRVSDSAHKLLGEPYAHNGDHVKLTTVKAGAVIFVWNNYAKPTTCHVTVANLLISPESKVLYNYGTFANWFDAGQYEFNELYKIPEWIPPGDYHLIKKTISYCGSDVTYTTNFDVKLTVNP